jgi:hypothetical protein
MKLRSPSYVDGQMSNNFFYRSPFSNLNNNDAGFLIFPILKQQKTEAVLYCTIENFCNETILLKIGWHCLSAADWSPMTKELKTNLER